MSSSQRPSSRTSTRTPPARSSMSLAGLDIEVTRQTEDWISATESRTARLALSGVHFDLENPNEGLEDGDDTPSSPLRAEYARSILSASCGSSMAPALIHQSAASACPPSLTSNSCYTEATPTETSISTGLANHLSPGFPLLEENNGVLELPRTQMRTPIYECTFWFLSCGFISRSQEEWMIHCESHFRGDDPPQAVQCPLCDWKWSHEDGRTSWNARMQHLALEHTMLGQTLRTSRPDFPLFHHLWRKRLIDDQDYKELLGGNHNLDRPPGNFVQTNGRERRRDREGRHRRQHVTTARTSGPHPR